MQVENNLPVTSCGATVRANATKIRNSGVLSCHPTVTIIFSWGSDWLPVVVFGFGGHSCWGIVIYCMWLHIITVSSVPLVVVWVTVAVVIWVQAVVLQTTGTLAAAWHSSTPVRLDLTWARTTYPPAVWSTLWNTACTRHQTEHGLCFS